MLKSLMNFAVCCCLLLLGWTETDIFQAKLIAFDPDHGKVTLQRKGRPEMPATLNPKARYWVKKAPVIADQFKPLVGNWVMVRMSIQTGEPSIVREMADLESWKWLEVVRKGVQRGAILTLEDELLILRFSDQTQFPYKITKTTQWQQQGQPVQPDRFKTGEFVYVAPRLLSNLDTMVTVVSDSELGAAIQKERLQPTVSGMMEWLDKAKKTFRVRSKAGDTREFYFDDKTEFRHQGKKLALEKVRSPANVTVHRRKDDDGRDYAHKVTIQSFIGDQKR